MRVKQQGRYAVRIYAIFVKVDFGKKVVEDPRGIMRGT
jgi:hypothetical protein